MDVKNRILAVLDPEVYDKLAPHLKQVSLEGRFFIIRGRRSVDLYFPIDCLLSITITMQDGTTTETGVIGNRDALSVNALMGERETTQTQYMNIQVGDSEYVTYLEDGQQLMNLLHYPSLPRLVVIERGEPENPQNPSCFSRGM